MNFQSFAKEIIIAIGGKENVKFVTHCSTRLRFELFDMTKPNEKKLEAMEGIVGVTNKGGQFQLIIGADVNAVYREVTKITETNNVTETKKKSEEKWYTKVLDIITGSITPVIPLICGSGLIAAFLALFTSMHWLDPASETYLVLNTLGNVGLYSLPVFLGFSVAKKVDTNPFYGALIGALMLHPNLVALTSQGISSIEYFGMPLRIVSYGSSMVPIFLAVIFLKYVERGLTRFIPKSLRIFIQPAFILLIVGSVSLLLFGPIGVIVGDGLAKIILSVNSYAAWAAVGLLGILLPWLTITGMHLSILPVAFIGLATVGFDALLFPAALVHNMAEGGAGLAVALKTKNKTLRSLALSNTFTVILGISEPILFTVHMKLKKPLFAVSIGGAVAGIFMGLFHVVAIAPGASVLTITAFVGATFVYAVIGAIIAFVVAFIAAWIIGFDDKEFFDAEDEKAVREVKITTVRERIESPSAGKLVSLDKLSDDTFSKLGSGIAIIPSDNKVVSPIKGKVTMIFPSKHAIGIINEDGLEILIHLGIDTVKLNGEGFDIKVKEGQIVNKGELLVEFDRELIESKGYDLSIIVIVTNSDKYLDIIESDKDEVKEGDVLLTLI